MGFVKNIHGNKLPRQGMMVGKRVRVCFHYDTSNTFEGEFVRDDAVHPFVEIIKLDDGRYILTTECQWQPADID